jgi:MFS family permease
MGAGFFGLFAFIPFYATSVHKLSTLMSGMILTPRSLALIPTAVVTSILLKRLGYRRPTAWGLSICGFAVLLLAPGLPTWRLFGGGKGAIELLCILMLATGMGAGLANPGAMNACVDLMPEKVATIIGVRGLFRTLGGAIGIFLITFILHFSSSPTMGFRITFFSFGLMLMGVVPLVLIIPDGEREQTKNMPPASLVSRS